MSNLPNRMPPIPQNPIADRISAKQAEINKPMACTECGSTYFFELEANEWATGGFGTVEFRLLSISAVRVKVCLCGHIIPPSPQAAQFGSRATGHLNFPESVDRAAELRAKNGVQGLVQLVPTRRELEEIKQDLETVKKDVDEKLNNVNTQLAALDTRTVGSITFGGADPSPAFGDARVALQPLALSEALVPPLFSPAETPVLTSAGKNKGSRKKS